MWSGCCWNRPATKLEKQPVSDRWETTSLPAHLSARTLLGRDSLLVLGTLAAVLATIIVVFPHDVPPVSYTHLTLPTIYSV